MKNVTTPRYHWHGKQAYEPIILTVFVVKELVKIEYTSAYSDGRQKDAKSSVVSAQ